MTNEELVEKLKEAYAKHGLKPCRRNFFYYDVNDKLVSCCPMLMLAIESKAIDVLVPNYALNTSFWARITFGLNWVIGFFEAYDHWDHPPTEPPHLMMGEQQMLKGWSAGIAVWEALFSNKIDSLCQHLNEKD